MEHLEEIWLNYRNKIIMVGVLLVGVIIVGEKYIIHRLVLIMIPLRRLIRKYRPPRNNHR